MPKLKLNKRTIANLNNMEMRYVVGGGGDDGDMSAKACDQEDLNKESSTIDEDYLEKLKKLIVGVQTKVLC